ncbi:MAG TPA: zinc ribbon domain-containing protein [Longimicrobiales bacterium]|nr:zinc ribbon domain-containing protein [Longimicrobiales bacterium]
MESTIRCPRCEQEVDVTDGTCPVCGHIHAGEPPCNRHPDRRADGVCVICGSGVCTECDNVSGVHHTCPDHCDIPLSQGWAQAYSTSDEVEAGLIRENLQAEGIDAEVLDQKDRSFNVDMGDLSPVRILVPAFQWLDARGVLDAHMDAEGEVAFACPSCGEAFDEGATVCANCGAPLPTPAG